MKYIGIDIGSTCAKTAVLDENGGFVLPTGWSSAGTAETIRLKLLEIDAHETPCVATGYGRGRYAGAIGAALHAMKGAKADG